MTEGSYNQFCPVAMAAEILGSRWTLVLLRELVAGSTRFNELRRGMPRMSPALLSKRLKELEAAGIVSRTSVPSESKPLRHHSTTGARAVGAPSLWAMLRSSCSCPVRCASAARTFEPSTS